jgi:hypothetical protein
MAERNIRSFQDYQTEGTLVRDVNTDMLLLEPDRTPLYVLTNNSKRKKSVYNPIFEWPEDADMPMIGAVSNGTTNYASNATNVFVADATLFGVNDVIQVPATSAGALSDLGTTAVGAGASEGGEAGLTGKTEELILVTAVALGAGTPSTATYQIGAVSGTITVTRGFAGTTAGTIGATQTLRIIGTAAQEGGAIDTPRAPYVNMKTSATQTFEWPIQLTRQAASTKMYYDRSERARLQMLAMRRQKLEIETVGLFGVFSQSVSGTSTRLTSMGVRSVISPFVTDVNGTLTYATFLASCRFAFRYGSPEKLLMAAPIVKEALDFFAGNKQLIKPDEKLFGVSLKRFITSNGTWLLANNFNMSDIGANYSQEALGLDLPSIDFCPLSENGINNDTQLITNYDQTNPKIIKDLVLTIAGWRPRHPARHYRLQGVLGYQ